MTTEVPTKTLRELITEKTEQEQERQAKAFEESRQSNLSRIRLAINTALKPYVVDWSNDQHEVIENTETHNAYLRHQVVIEIEGYKIRGIMTMRGNSGWRPATEVFIGSDNLGEEVWREFRTLVELPRVVDQGLTKSERERTERIEPEQEQSAQARFEGRKNKLRSEPEDDALELLAASMGMCGHDMDPVHSALMSCAASLICISKDIRSLT